MVVILNYVEDVGFFLMDPSGQAACAIWFTTFEDAEAYCLENGLNMFVGGCDERD